jgi:hypothetical protein
MGNIFNRAMLRTSAFAGGLAALDAFPFSPP